MSTVEEIGLTMKEDMTIKIISANRAEETNLRAKLAFTFYFSLACFYPDS